ncbi:MAG: VF530 family protein [Methylococcales bacterium]|nr:VF530 family protein [Methylococcales bacterium]MDD5755074.1 VF530 family protein [Methylococcales bacterium]
MTDKKRRQHLNGVTLETILNELVAYYGWHELSELVKIRCFYNDPSIKSSLMFLRKTPWARTEVEMLYCSLKEPD